SSSIIERDKGKIPSSKPIKKTTGNSNPLAACNVIKVTSLCGSSSILSKSEINARSVKKVNKLLSSLLSFSNCCVTDKNSLIFSTRVSASRVRSASKLSKYPLRSNVSSTNFVTGKNS